ncbi:MAG: MerR family transcriptional regulator [Firmicutes bacterium]|nr:MerR family transcriptional regulator [Bacillota bacterium]
MSLRNCNRCGVVFSSRGSRICPRCLQREQEEFEIVRDYIRKNPGATVAETSIATEVPVEQINQFVREGRLILSRPELQCQSCGDLIASGRFCTKCLAAMRRDLGRSQPQFQSQGKSEPTVGKGDPPSKRERFHSKAAIIRRQDR